jgi:raffinose/stachyose/melibiose transport system substrate-binding protein
MRGYRKKKVHISIRLMFVILIAMSSICGCQNRGEEAQEEKQVLKISVDVKDKHSLSIFQFLTDEFKKENKNIELDIKSPLDIQKLESDIIKGGEVDVLLTSRNTMLQLNEKGLLNDMGNFYANNEIGDKYYNIVTSYGRIGDKYYGVGLMPYSIEFFYNTEGLQKMGAAPPKNIVEVIPILRKLNEENTKIPMVLTEDIDVYNALAAILYSNIGDVQRLENKFKAGKAGYEQMDEMQKVFEEINNLVKAGAINRDTFEAGAENAVNRMINGDIPIVTAISYYSKNIKDTAVGVIEKYEISPVYDNIPIIINAILCTPANAENEEGINDFLEFVYSDDIQKKLVKEGFVTGHREANENMVGTNKIIEEHISRATDNSILFIYNLPEEFKSKLEAKIMNITEGKYSGNEWKEIINEIYQ